MDSHGIGVNQKLDVNLVSTSIMLYVRSYAGC